MTSVDRGVATGAGAPNNLMIAAAFAAIYLVWGSTYLAIKYAIESVPPFLMTGARFLIAGSVLTMWVLESIGVAVDQWYGHTADPSSPVVSAGMVWVFAALAATGCVPMYYFYRRLGK